MRNVLVVRLRFEVTAVGLHNEHEWGWGREGFIHGSNHGFTIPLSPPSR